jgi:hypothetical protein
LSVSDTSAIRSLQSFDSIDGQNSSTETDIQVEAPGYISQYEADPTSPVSKVFDISALSQAELMSVMTDTPTHSARIEEVAELLRTLIPLGECQLHPEECTKLLEILDKVCGGREPVYNHGPTVKPPIKFKDAVGRKFSFPWHLCKSWKVRRIWSHHDDTVYWLLNQGMEELIKQAFLHVDIIGPHVHEGHYDLVGPDGEIIPPQVWETMVQPDWTVTMHMWTMPEPPLTSTITTEKIVLADHVQTARDWQEQESEAGQGQGQAQAYNASPGRLADHAPSTIATATATTITINVAADDRQNWYSRDRSIDLKSIPYL